MKKSLLIISIILALTVKYADAQKNLSRNVIIFANGDTLSSPKIIGSKALTNQDGIVYIDKQNSMQKLTACQVREYYLDNEYFHSETIKNDNICRLVTYEVGGYVSFGLSYTSNGDMNFYVKKNDDVTSLEKYRFDLKSFFSTYLVDFDQFYATYKVRLSYDFKTLAQMISAYNAYKYPEKYVFEHVKNKEKGRIGIIASAGMTTTNLKGFYEDDLKGGSFSIGLDRESRYSRCFAIHMPLTYNVSTVKSSNTSIHWSTVNFEPYISLRTIPKKKINFEIGAGIGILYSLNSYLDGSSIPGSDQDKVTLTKAGFGPNFSFIANLDRKLKAQLMFAQYQAKSASIKVGSPEDTKVKALTNNFRLLISYYF
ncbi:MAG: hypothetical protein Q7U54_21170 [Bacteroidales bacterium]|nr:hypothetical protein [Bacteroidales bacterium]